MKKVILAVALFFTMSIVATNQVQAQGQGKGTQNVGQIVSGLINVNIGAINVSDITVADLVDVNVVLSNNDVDILNNVLNHSPILSNNSDILTNLLRDAKILDGTQVVVGVLSGQFVTQAVPIHNLSIFYEIV
jgi:hypothetical protein